jgi:hypothetical protein
MLINRPRIEKIKQQIAQAYPEFKGIEPKITEKDVSPQDEIFQKLDIGVPKQLRHIYRLKFTRVIETTDKVPIDRILMVTLDENFEIIKIIESR